MTSVIIVNNIVVLKIIFLKKEYAHCNLKPYIVIIQIDLASEEKKRLEEKQRAARKNRSKSDEEWKPR